PQRGACARGGGRDAGGRRCAGGARMSATAQAPASLPVAAPRRGSLPPGPGGPALWQFLQMAERPLEKLLGWHARYGDCFTVSWPVFGTGVYVADPQAIRALHTGDQSDLRAGEANAPLGMMLGDRSVLVLDGPEHLRQRRLLLPPFQGSAVGAFRAVIRDV